MFGKVFLATDFVGNSVYGIFYEVLSKQITCGSCGSAKPYAINPTSTTKYYIKLEFEENVAPDEVNEIQLLTNDPKMPTADSNQLTRLGDTFIFERTDPEALGLREPKNPRKATNVYAYEVKKPIKIAYTAGQILASPITMPDNQKIKLTPFPLKNIDDERTNILAAPSTSVYVLDPQKMPYAAAIAPIELPNHDRTKNTIVQTHGIHKQD